MRPILLLMAFTALGGLAACSGGTDDSDEAPTAGAPHAPPIGGHDLDKSTVTSIADGDANGTAFAGEYEVEIHTSACEGACGPIESFGLAVTFCDVGETDHDQPNVTQTDGHVRMDTNAAVTRMEGGIDAEGSFDVGGYATALGGAIEVTGRVTGRLDVGVHAMTAEASGWAQGVVDGHYIDCVGTYEIRPAGD